jgi:pyrroline-5-carboxylate reductase
MRIGIIGRGTLGGAIERGLSGHASVRTIESTTRETAESNPVLVENSDVVLLCVKPHQAPGVLRQIAPSLRPHHVLISAAASVSASAIREDTGNVARVIRAMPNTPAQVGSAMTVFARDAHTNDEALDIAQHLFSAFGRTEVLDEKLMDAVTAISGCGPAYIFVVIEALIDAAIALGIPYEIARVMVAQTVVGSGQLVLDSDVHPASLRTDVATPGGRTIRGLIELEKGGLRAALIACALAAAS